MSRRAAIYFRDTLAGYLSETDDGYSFQYEIEYLANNNQAVNLTLPLMETTSYLQ